jgi:hypothetical protein
MTWRQKKHPIREASIQDVRLVDHSAVEIVISYVTRTDRFTTLHEHVFRISLCDTKHLGFKLHGIATKLQAKLNDFKRAISGG